MRVIAPADRYLVALGDNVTAGQVVEVDDETGASLVEQGWEQAGDAEVDLNAMNKNQLITFANHHELVIDAHAKVGVIRDQIAAGLTETEPDIEPGDATSITTEEV